MKTFFELLLLILFSIIIGVCINTLTTPYIIKDVNGNNIINIEMSFIDQSGIFGIKAYDENNKLSLNEQKTISIEKSNFVSNKSLESYVLKSYSITIPVINSHKIELEFSGNTSHETVLLINNIAANNRTISVKSFLNKSKASQHYQIGTIKEVPGTFIKFQNKLVLDVSKALNVPSLTQNELQKLNKEYSELYLLLCFFFIICDFLLNYIIYLVLNKYISSNEKLLVYYFISILAVISAIVLIISSYFIHLRTAINYLNQERGILFNYLTFQQNFIPLLSFTFIFILGSCIINNKFVKILFTIPAWAISIVLIVDNCILNVLGARLNFRMNDNFSWKISYFHEFIIKYITSESGILMIAGIFIILTLCVLSFFIKINNRKFCYSTGSVLMIISLLGLYPRELLSTDFKFANPFQINGWCLNKVGNFENSYSKDYAKRNNLDLEWTEQPGLNQKKNVILLLVESWGCSFTFACGLGPSYMPKIESLSVDNFFFDNYYSIMPSTSMSYLSIVKGAPAIQFAWDSGKSKSSAEHDFSPNDVLYDANDLIKQFKSNGYKTRFISSTDLVFQMDSALKFSKYDEIIDAKNPVFAHITERSVFNSVNDEQLFSFILSKIKTEKNPYLYITKTASNHSPYNSPLGYQNLELSFKYTDQAVYDFVTALKDSGYFDNGILVMLGDHHAWGDDSIDPSHSNEPTYINKVPLIIIDGKTHGVVNHNVFSHASLGVLLQYLELPKYKKHKFNINPLVDDSPELIFGYEFEKMTFFSIKQGDRQATVILDGDNSEFIEKDVFSEEEMDDILGYIATFRR